MAAANHETEFQNVTITISGADPVDAYNRLCAALETLNGEYQTDGYTFRESSIGHAVVSEGDTSELWPCSSDPTGHKYVDGACTECSEDEPEYHKKGFACSSSETPASST